jgi:hypothetical protein
MNSIINQVLGYVGKANNALRISTVNNSVVIGKFKTKQVCESQRADHLK